MQNRIWAVLFPTKITVSKLCLRRPCFYGATLVSTVQLLAWDSYGASLGSDHAVGDWCNVGSHRNRQKRSSILEVHRSLLVFPNLRCVNTLQHSRYFEEPPWKLVAFGYLQVSEREPLHMHRFYKGISVFPRTVAKLKPNRVRWTVHENKCDIFLAIGAHRMGTTGRLVRTPGLRHVLVAFRRALAAGARSKVTRRLSVAKERTNQAPLSSL